MQKIYSGIPLFIASLLATNITVAVPAAKPADGQSVTRTITFPKDSIGTVCKILVDARVFAQNGLTMLAPAAGKVEIKLAPQEETCLMFNMQVLKHLSQVETIDAAYIDGIKLNIMSMDDDTISQSDKILPVVSHFSHVKFLLLDRSDCTDEGLLALKPMPQLRRLSASMSGVTGSFLQHVQNFPELSTLALFSCPLQQKNLVDLPKLHSLRDLDIHHTKSGGETLKMVSQCSNLESLVISENPDINDAGIASLLRLKHLYELDIHDTSVSMEGLKKLRPLADQLKQLKVKSDLRPQEKQIAALFPKTQVSFMSRGRRLHDAEKNMWAPLK